MTVYIESIATLKLVTHVEVPDGTDPDAAMGKAYAIVVNTPWDEWTVLDVTDTAFFPNDPTEYVPADAPDPTVPAPSTDAIMAEVFPWEVAE